ncbi:MAG: beta-hydroxyacyl-ACP dehydratase [Candidatus Amulumruptor caecigallinarius]|nr:beta-hydroxyacyl-ACP dehydratase [Candidatus Amulumruptor caecigallinarius]MCM1396356.1 beta-hydroxyacyl-ACP dehydratase [Candidatus Amulumruptor caecigallinarius]MCM1453702.1 beta-hydroxyacyl-ACP dehydratase [bacterium]
MKLQDNLYSISSIDGLTAEVTLCPGSDIFAAHFPGRPVTPGVCIIGIATELLSRITGLSLSLREVVNAKFLAVIDPRESPSVTYSFSRLTRDEAAGSLKATAVVSRGDVIFAKLSLLYIA